jgi:hypothetical protein
MHSWIDSNAGEHTPLGEEVSREIRSVTLIDASVSATLLVTWFHGTSTSIYVLKSV